MELLAAFMLLCSLLGVSTNASATAQSPSFASRQAISLAEKDSQTCTIDSFRNVSSFILKEYQVETLTVATDGGPAGGTTQTRATLSVENPGTGDTYRLYHIPVSVIGGVWSVCRPGSEAPLPSQLVYCQYLIERRSHRIGFRFQWNCDGDPKQPVTFDATVIGDLPDEVCVPRNGTDGVTQVCSLPAGAGEVLLDVVNIEWAAESEPMK